MAAAASSPNRISKPQTPVYDLQQLYSDQLASSVALGETSVALARARLWIFRIALHPAGSDVSKFARNANDQLDQSEKAWDAFRTLPFSDADEQRDAGEVNTRLENLLTTGYAGFSGYRVRRRRQNQICCVSHVSSTIWRCHRQNRLA
jgi:hypothetical protein